MCDGSGLWLIVAHAAQLALIMALLGLIAAALDRWGELLVRCGCLLETAEHLRASAKWLLIIDLCVVLVDAVAFSIRTAWCLVPS